MYTQYGIFSSGIFVVLIFACFSKIYFLPFNTLKHGQAFSLIILFVVSSSFQTVERVMFSLGHR